MKGSKTLGQMIESSLIHKRKFNELTSKLKLAIEKAEAGDTSLETLCEIETLKSLIAKVHRKLESDISSSIRAVQKAKSRLEAKQIYHNAVTKEVLEKQWKRFVTTSLPIVASGTAIMCGKNQCDSIYIIPRETFVCVREKIKGANDQFFLGLIVDITPGGKYQIYDVDSSCKTLKKLTLDRSKFVTCPECLERTVGGPSDYQVGDRVLALFYDATEWTTVFYKASIKSLPEERGKGYMIAYEDEEDMYVVPEKFIVPYYE